MHLVVVYLPNIYYTYVHYTPSILVCPHCGSIVCIVVRKSQGNDGRRNERRRWFILYVHSFKDLEERKFFALTTTSTYAYNSIYTTCMCVRRKDHHHQTPPGAKVCTDARTDVLKKSSSSSVLKTPTLLCLVTAAWADRRTDKQTDSCS